jgi:deoxyadenosine/deoxycytidine kinase
MLGPDASRRSLVIELLGPAGSGKSSLARELAARDDRIHAGLKLERWKYAWPVTRRLAGFLPAWAVGRPHDRWFDRRDMRSIARLETWSEALQKDRALGERATIFDHGPLYRLARLREFGPAVTRSERFTTWWQGSLRYWLNTLDLVVWLDASDAILVQRAGSRGHWYLRGEDSLADKQEFLARYRRAFDEVLDGTAARPRILRCRSDERPVDAIADEVLEAIGAPGSDRSREWSR